MKDMREKSMRAEDESSDPKNNINIDKGSSGNTNTITSDERTDEANVTKIGAWEAHTRGFASREMYKYGYRGKGLGKNEDGITEPIRGEKKTSFETDHTQHHHNSASNEGQWPKNTVLIAGDSMLGGIDEKRLGRNVKVRWHGGATADDMGHHLTAHLRKKPSHVILHAGTNDAQEQETNKTAESIFQEILDIRSYIKSLVPDVKMTVSCPIVRKDDTAVNIKVIHIRSLLRTSGIELMTNENIGPEHIAKRGVHLNQGGTWQLAKNFIQYLQSL